MSQATKKKYVAREVLEDFPEPSDTQVIVQLVANRGNNLHDCLWPDGKQALCSMPPKYRRSIWMKIGQYLIVDPIEEGDRVQGEIAAILYHEQVAHLKRSGQWPQAFLDDEESEALAAKQKAAEAVAKREIVSAPVDLLAGMEEGGGFNPNWRQAASAVSDSDESSTDEEEEEG